MRAGSLHFERGQVRPLPSVLAVLVAAATVAAAVAAPSAWGDALDVNAPRTVGSPQFTANDGRPSLLAVSPDGTLVAVDDNASPGRVSLLQASSPSPLAYAAGFHQLPGNPVATGALPAKLAFNPSGTLLAVANSGSASVSVYQVDATSPTQALTPVAGSPFPTGAGPNALAFSPDGTMLAVANTPVETVSLFTVSASGALVAATDSPFPVAVPARHQLLDAKFTPNGRFLAVASGFAQLGTNGTGEVSMFSVSGSSDPSLTAVAGSPFPARTAVATLSMDGSKNLMAALGLGNELSMFSIGSSGSLTQAAGSPFSLGGSSAQDDDAQFSPGGSMLAVADTSQAGANTAIYRVANDGSLTNVATIAPSVGGDYPQSVAWAPKQSAEGEVLFVNAGEFQAYTVGPFASITTPSTGSA